MLIVHLDVRAAQLKSLSVPLYDGTCRSARHEESVFDIRSRTYNPQCRARGWAHDTLQPHFDNPPDPFQGSPHKDRIGYEYLILKEKLRKWLCSAVHSEFWRERGILLFVDCFVWVAISLDGYEWVKKKKKCVESVNFKRKNLQVVAFFFF